jgi:hypothetical protein
MAGRVEVLKRVRVRRVLATSDVATGEAHTKLGPRFAEREAFFASIGARRRLSNLAEVFATLAHVEASDG